MASFLEYAKGLEVQPNTAIASFVAAALKQKRAFETGESNRRSWVKEEVNGFYVKLGKLDKTYLLKEKEDVSDFFHRAVVAAQTEGDFMALVKAAYGSSDEQPKRRGRKTRTV